MHTYQATTVWSSPMMSSNPLQWVGRRQGGSRAQGACEAAPEAAAQTVRPHEEGSGERRPYRAVGQLGRAGQWGRLAAHLSDGPCAQDEAERA
eukprot:2704718-Prymnesium_polylepis.1